MLLMCVVKWRSTKAAKVDLFTLEGKILFLHSNVLQCRSFSLAFLEDKHEIEERSCNFSTGV